MRSVYRLKYFHHEEHDLYEFRKFFFASFVHFVMSLFCHYPE